MSYRFIEDVAIADVAFEASGRNLNELFEFCALAVSNTMIKNMKSISKKVKKEVNLEADNIEMLLNIFLQQIIFYKDAEQLLFGKFDVTIKGKNGKYILKSRFYGEKINPKKHELLVDVKSVTWHLFSVKKSGKKWMATVVLDI